MRKKPVTCGFFKWEIIVCCVENRVSQEKCKEFRKKDEPKLTIRVLQGQLTMEGELPHMAAVGYYDRGRRELRWRCAGTLISDQYIMTAAHCCKSMDKPAKVLLGTTHISKEIIQENLYEIDQKNIIVHPEYKAPYHDIGLLKLTRKVIFSEFISPACLYSKPEDPKVALITAGWGATDSFGRKMSDSLLMTYLQAAPLNECGEAYKSTYAKGVDNSFICAGDPRGESDTCRGDSGGPLFLKESSGVSVVGITSLGKDPCGSPVSVYVRVSKYVDWIEKTVWS